MTAVPELPAGTGGTEAPASSGTGLWRGDKGGDRGTGCEEQDRWGEDRTSRQSRQAPADVASPPKGARCFPGSHHQERLCAHQGAPLPLSQPRNGISLPVLAPPSPFVSFLHPRRFCLRWMRYFGKQGLSCPDQERCPGLLLICSESCSGCQRPQPPLAGGPGLLPVTWSCLPCSCTRPRF